MNKVIVAGASGLVGHAAIRHFTALPGWEVVGVSRRTPADLPGAQLLAVNLLNPEACQAAFGAMSDVTHVVYAALQETPGLFPGWTDEANIERNGAMLRNLFEPIAAVAKGLQHVSLLHGTKAYGLHHPAVNRASVHNPLREREPRIEHRNFYWVQEDYLNEKQQGASWGITTFRPTVIYGGAWGANMNPLPAICVYGALLKQAGEPLHYPFAEHEPVIREAVDADLVADAIGWAATTPTARGEAFNLTNGDVFTWQGVWPAIAEALGMRAGDHRPFSFAQDLPKRSGEWAALVAKHNLRAPAALLDFVGENSLVYTDMLMTAPARPLPPILNSTIKGRLAGFQACIDTEDMFRKWIAKLQEERVIPAP
jgi:nucleoside-diphosphate-sugar epimerase